MDLDKIGKFIKNERKAKNLTQSELAEKLFVSEKTISKWECGNGFPDTSLMLPLCEILEISANELLSGKRLLDNEYKKCAENNLLELKRENENNIRLLFSTEVVLGYTATILFFVFLALSIIAPIAMWLRIVIGVVGLIHFIVGIHFCLLIEKDAGYYECKHCHNKYTPSYKQVLYAMHMGRTRYMCCPKCNKMSWQKKKINKD